MNHYECNTNRDYGIASHQIKTMYLPSPNFEHRVLHIGTLSLAFNGLLLD